jgi:CRP-like cAMP-binding protein
VAVAESELAVIDAKRFEFMVKHVPSFAIELMRILAARLMEMNKRVRSPA